MKGKIASLLFCAALLCNAQRKEYERPVRQASRGLHGAIGAGSDYAAEAGMRLYIHGGNAVDAAIAAMFAAMTTEFSHIGWGGEAPILVRTADGKVHSIPGVGTMPKLATAEFYRTRRLQPFEVLEMDPGGLRGIIPVAGLMPVLVPGSVDAGLVAIENYGTKSFSEVAAPAIDLADGEPIDEQRSGAIARSRRFFDIWPTSRKVFLPNGRVPLPGEIFRQPDLARTLRAMADAEQAALKAGASRSAAIDAVRDYLLPRRIAHNIDAFIASQQRPASLRRHGRLPRRARRSRLHHLPRLHRLQARLLEPGPRSASKL